MNNFNINLAVKCIKTLVDNCRCVNCDKLNETRMRYPCGHSICDKCVVINETCMFCSPFSNDPPILDEPQSERVRNTIELLKTFQELFNVDVFRHHRISEQLKVEKELFPQCIQAPVKYFNKRKSSIFIEKENLRPSLFQGENVSSTEKAKMEKSINHVQQWLNQNEKSLKLKKMPRKPLSDLSVNSQNNKNMRKTKKSTSIKRSLTEDLTLRFKKIKKDESIDTKIETKLRKCDNNESGISLDDDTLIIDDSQSDTGDKDKLALMAIIQAEQKESNFINTDLDLKEIPNKEKPKCCLQSTSNYKVPFYKKSYLIENCHLCVQDLQHSKKKERHTKNVSVTIDNKSFVTTIKLSQVKPNYNKNVSKKSIAIQAADTQSGFDMDDTPKVINDLPCEAINNVNQEMFPGNGANKSKCVIIEDSDADSSDADCGKELEIEAEVHRSSDLIDYVLTPLESQDYTNRIRPVRGKTPASSDSSDKENFDPNKKKRSKYSKQLKNKKVKKYI